MDQVAIHEAGHAVMAVHLRWDLEWVGLNPPAVKVHDVRDDPDTPKERLLIAVAGCAAEIVSDEREIDAIEEYWQREGCLMDRTQAHTNALQVEKDVIEARELVQESLRQAVDILKQPLYRRAVGEAAKLLRQPSGCDAFDLEKHIRAIIRPNMSV
jgi:hypothetical protein